MNARVYPPDRPVSSKSCCPGKAELGVQFIARDPDHLVRSVQWGHPALWRESAGQRGPKLALVVVLRSRSAWTSRTSTLDARGRDLRVLRGCTTARDRTESVSRYEYQSMGIIVYKVGSVQPEGDLVRWTPAQPRSPIQLGTKAVYHLTTLLPTPPPAPHLGASRRV